jgi:predicted Ser/Thr protein kinase
MARKSTATQDTNKGLRSVEKGDPRYWVQETYTGPLSGMWDVVTKHPVTMETALMRGSRLVVRQGINHTETTNIRSITGDQRIICWNAFNKYFGIELVLSRFAAGLRSAALNDEQAFQVFAFYGGPSTAKSAIANDMKEMFCDSEPVMCLGDSVVRAHPLCGPAMIPVLSNIMAKGGGIKEAAAHRMAFLKAVNLSEVLRFDRFDSKAIFERNQLEPSLESMCKLPRNADFLSVMTDGLGLSRSIRTIVGFPDMQVYEPFLRAARGQQGAGDPIDMMKNLSIATFRFLNSDEGSVGISTVKETEPFKFDFAEVYGEEDLSALVKKNVNPEDMIKLIGAYNHANGGVMEWVEFGKNGISAIRSILEATQDKRNRYPAPFGTRTLLLNCLLLAHTNWFEYERLITTPGNEPFEDRFFGLPVLQPYRADAIRKTLVKQRNRADYSRPESEERLNIDPLVDEMVADLVSYDRIKLPEVVKLPPLKVIDILAGAYYEPVEEGTRSNVELLLAQLGDLQGMDGKTLRWAQKYIAEQAGLSVSNGCNFVLSKDVLQWMDRMLSMERQLRGEDPSKDKTTPPTSRLGKLQVFLRNDLDKRRKKRMAQMVRISLQIALKTQGSEMSNLRQAYANRYLNLIERMGEDDSSVTAEDRAFVTKVETNIGVPSSSGESFRKAVSIFRGKAKDARSAQTRQDVEAGNLEPGKKAELPLEAFEPLRRAIDRTIAGEMSVDTATSILLAEVGKEADQKEQGLSTMSELYGLTLEIAREYAKEVAEGNYLNELGDKDEY